MDADACPLSDLKAIVATLAVRAIRPVNEISTVWSLRKWLKSRRKPQHECPNLMAIVQRLDELVSLFARLSHVLMLDLGAPIAGRCAGDEGAKRNG